MAYRRRADHGVASHASNVTYTNVYVALPRDESGESRGAQPVALLEERAGQLRSCWAPSLTGVPGAVGVAQPPTDGLPGEDFCGVGSLCGEMSIFRDTFSGEPTTLSRMIGESVDGVSAEATLEDRDQAATEAASEIGREIHRNRLLRHWTQTRLAKEAKVARCTINEVERGRRFPSVGTYARLREALGLEAPPAALLPRHRPVANLTDDLLRRLCATVIAARRVPLADLASALDISMAACREFPARRSAAPGPGGMYSPRRRG